jgi:hypothetical protein
MGISGLVKWKQQYAIPVFFAALFLLCNIFRAAVIPITHDEAWTRALLSNSYLQILQYTHFTTNNHLLNSLLSKFFISVFGDTVFVLRLANVLAQIPYLIFSWKLAERLCHHFLWILGFWMVLQLHPVLFEFWGMCRGYGLATAAMMASIYFFVVFLHDKKSQGLAMALLCAMTAVYANISYFNYFLALPCCWAAVVLLQPNRNRKQILLAQLPIIVLATGVLLVSLLGLMMRFRDDGQIFGGDTGIFSDTIKSLMHITFFTDTQSLLVRGSSWAILLTSVLPVLFWARHLRSKGDTTGLILWVMLTAPAVAIWAQHLLFRSKFPMERTALYFVPLYFIHLIYWLYSLRHYLKVLNIVPFGVVIIMSVTVFLQKTDLDSIILWRYDMFDVAVPERIIHHHHENGSKIRLRTNWLFCPSFNYYIERKYATKFEPLVFSKEMPTNDTSYDYYYVCKEDVVKIPCNYVLDTCYLRKYFLYRKAIGRDK